MRGESFTSPKSVSAGACLDSSTALSRRAPCLLVTNFPIVPVVALYLSGRSYPGRARSPGRCPQCTRSSGSRNGRSRSQIPVCSSPCRVVCPRRVVSIRFHLVFPSVTAMFMGRSVVMAVTFGWPVRRSLPAGLVRYVVSQPVDGFLFCQARVGSSQNATL